MVFKQETIKSWFTGVGSSINTEVVQPFQNAKSIISKYNLAIQHNSLTQQGWQRILAQSDDSLKAYLTSIKGTTASMSGYNVSLQGNITGFTKITKAMQQYNALGSTSQKEQQAFATSVGTTNTKLGSYLTGLNGAEASLSGYGLSLIASTAKTIGLTVATTALNATLTMGISLIVSGLISAFASWIHKSEEITEKAQESADKINSINDSLKSNTETVENAKKRYAELAQEVENLGKITQSQGTLSNKEYEEFLDLSNQLAGIFPSLTKNYDVNGNAILNLSGDVNTIVGSLDSLLQKEKELANQKIMEEFPNVFKGWNQDLSDAEQKVKSEKTEFGKINQAYSSLKKGQSIQMGFNANGSNIDTDGKLTTIGQYEGWLNDLGLTYEENVVAGGKVVTAIGDIDTAFTSKLEKAREDLQYAQQQLERQTSSINQYLNTWLQGEFSYIQIEDSGLQTAIQDMLFNFDWSSLPKGIDKNDWYAVSEYLRRNILFSINNINDSEVSAALANIYSGNLNSGQLLDAIAKVQGYFGSEHPISLNLQAQVDDTQPLINNVKEKLQDEFDDKVGELTLDELKIATEQIEVSEGDLLSWDELIAKIKEVQDSTSHSESQNFADKLFSSTESIDQFKSSLQSAFDAYSTLLSDDLSASDLLSSIQEINKAAKEMGKDINWEFIKNDADINGTVHALELLGNAMEIISEKSLRTELEGMGFSESLINSIVEVQRAQSEFDALTGNIDRLQSSYQTLSDIIQSYSETGHINLDNLQSLLTADSNLIAMLEVENGQLVINKAAYEELVYAQLLEFKTKLEAAAAAEIEALAKNKAQEATNDNANASNDAVAKLDSETSALNRNTIAAVANKAATENGVTITEEEIDGIYQKYNKIWDSALDSLAGDFDGFTNASKKVSQAAKEEVNVLSDLNSEMDKLQSAYKSLCDIKDTYNKYGRITVDQYQELTDLGFNFLANLVDENGQLGLNASAFERLAQAKLEEMQIQMARNAANAINGLKTEAAAVEYLTYATEQNRQAALGAAEAELQWAVAAAKRRGEQQGLAAEQIYQGYQASKQLAGSVDLFFDPSAQEKENSREDDANKLLDAYNKEKSILEHMLAMDQISKAEYYDRLMKLVHQYFDGDEEHQDQIWDVEEGYHDYLESIKETYNWIEIFLENLAKKADALIDKAGKFITWSKKNAMINRAVKATDKQITGQTNAYAYYAEKARKVGLNNAYIDKIQNGTLTMEDMQNESLSDKIEKYQEWYDKMVACEDAIGELYDQERDLLKQKLDNVLEYYNDLDSYMSSIVSKMDSFISLMDDMGKRSSLTDLLEQFAAADGLPNGWNYIFKKILTLSYTYGDWSL